MIYICGHCAKLVKHADAIWVQGQDEDTPRAHCNSCEGPLFDQTMKRARGTAEDAPWTSELAYEQLELRFGEGRECA